MLDHVGGHLLQPILLMTVLCVRPLEKQAVEVLQFTFAISARPSLLLVVGETDNCISHRQAVRKAVQEEGCEESHRPRDMFNLSEVAVRFDEWHNGYQLEKNGSRPSF